MHVCIKFRLRAPNYLVALFRTTTIFELPCINWILHFISANMIHMYSIRQKRVTFLFRCYHQLKQRSVPFRFLFVLFYDYARTEWLWACFTNVTNFAHSLLEQSQCFHLATCIVTVREVAITDSKSVPSACKVRALPSELQGGVNWAAHASKASVG